MPGCSSAACSRPRAVALVPRPRPATRALCATSSRRTRHRPLVEAPRGDGMSAPVSSTEGRSTAAAPMSGPHRKGCRSAVGPTSADARRARPGVPVRPIRPPTRRGCRGIVSPPAGCRRSTSPASSITSCASRTQLLGGRRFPWAPAP
jgi:hypothetical protein